MFPLFLAILAMLSVGCERGEDDKIDTPQADVELRLTTDDVVWFDIEGGVGEIGYVLENTTNSSALTASSAEDWITDISVGDVISYRVTENGASEVRRGVISVECDDKAFEVSVMQHAVADTSKLSTLGVDYEFDIDGGVFVGAFVGDLMNAGCNTCQLYMWEYLDLETGEERGDTFQIDLQLPRDSRDICGTYTEGTVEGEFIPGSVDNLGGQYMQQNSWYITADFATFAPMKRGKVSVESNDNIFYTITVDVVDDYGYAIRGVFRGTGEFIDW